MHFGPVILLSIIILVLAYLTTWLFRSISSSRNIIDIPNDRSSHTVPTPRGGGIAILISWYAGISVLFIVEFIGLNLYLAFLSGIILAATSLLDDIVSIRPSIRILAQTVTSILAIYFLGGFNSVDIIGKLSIPAIITFPVSVIGMIWFINLYNFLDGIDGYASIQAICISAALFLFTGAGINMILIACVAGFLIWNWPPAKIFMGDIGSTQLGFILVVLGIYYHNENTLPFMWWLVLTSPFWFDATLTLFRRWRNGEKLSQAHKKHAYQRLVQSGFSHLKVDLLLVSTNVLLVIVVSLCINTRWLQIPVLLFISSLLYLVTVIIDRRKPFPKD